MISDTDSPHKAETHPQQSPHPFRPSKLLVLIVVILLSALVAAGAYLVKTQQTVKKRPEVGRYFLRRISTQPYTSPSEPSHQRLSVDSPTLVTPGWKLLQFQSQEMHFTIQYPSYLLLEEKEYRPGDRILFDSHNPNGRNVGLEISYATGDPVPDSHSLTKALLTAPIGNVPTENIAGYNDNIITKLADLTINGHRAVHATFFRKGGVYQEPRFCESYLVIKDNSHDYSLDACTTNATYKEAKAEVTQYSSLMEQIVNTFMTN